ncbi:MAG: redoxin domain-containing protein [Luteibaculum sp.]
MKTLIPYLSFLALLVGCKSENSFEIEGNFPAAAGNYIILQQSVNNKTLTLDSVLINKNGEFSMETELNAMDFLTLSTGQEGYLVLAKPGEELNITWGEEISDVNTLTGFEEAVKFWEINRHSQELNKRRLALNDRFQNGEMSRETAVNEFNEINQEWQEYARNFAENNPSSPAILSALNVFHPIEDLDVYKNTLNALKPKMGNSDYVKRLEEQVQQAESQADAYNAQKKAEEEREQLLAAGKEAPEISLPTPAGKELKLSSLRGKYVLVDFWASWCKPCRMENPNVKKAYDKYHAKGFEIYSVSLDKNKTAWLNAIKADGMNWKHVSDLKFWGSEAAQAYGVNSIPFTLLLDKEGKIIAKNLRGEALHQKLEELFNA